MGGKAASTNSTSTTAISDSYNKTENIVSNLSDVGNIQLTLGGLDAGAEATTRLLPYAILGGALFVVALIFGLRRH